MKNAEKLEYVLESLLFISGEGLKISEIQDSLGIDRKELNAAIKQLQKKFSGSSGIYLITYNGKIQFGSNPDYAEDVAAVLNPIREKALSTATLETVAIIAYKQPVTRLEIENIRGVNSDYAIQVLLKNNLIEIVGRKDVIGRPLLFGTTDTFLKRFRISDISELPDYDELLNNIKIVNDTIGEAANPQSIYNEFELPPEEVPEFLNGEDVNKIE